MRLGTRQERILRELIEEEDHARIEPGDFTTVWTRCEMHGKDLSCCRGMEARGLVVMEQDTTPFGRDVWLAGATDAARNMIANKEVRVSE
jgi:hypothetical protein